MVAGYPARGANRMRPPPAALRGASWPGGRVTARRSCPSQRCAHGRSTRVGRGASPLSSVLTPAGRTDVAERVRAPATRRLPASDGEAPARACDDPRGSPSDAGVRDHDRRHPPRSTSRASRRTSTLELGCRRTRRRPARRRLVAASRPPSAATRTTAARCSATAQNDDGRHQGARRTDLSDARPLRRFRLLRQLEAAGLDAATGEAGARQRARGVAGAVGRASARRASGVGGSSGPKTSSSVLPSSSATNSSFSIVSRLSRISEVSVRRLAVLHEDLDRALVRGLDDAADLVVDLAGDLVGVVGLAS